MSTEETQNEIASSIITNVLAISDEQLAGLSDDAVLYEDGTCKITKAGILLKNFYMPMQQEKFVPIAHILRVYVHFKFWMSSQWGLSDTKTWWSKDNSRVKGCSCIIIRTGSMMMKGFSPNAGNPETVKEVGDLLQKIVPGGPGMVQYIGY